MFEEPGQEHLDGNARGGTRRQPAFPAAVAVSGERRARILAELVRGDGLNAARLCEVAETVVGVSGAGIMIMSGDLPAGSLCTTNAMSRAIEDLQYTLGEGPCVDAYNLDRPVLEPDLEAPAEPRWLAFPRAALDCGARAVFGFPLRVGSVRLGALNLCCDRPGPLHDDQYADAVVMADVSAESVLALQAGAPPGELADALEDGSNFHTVVHQAAGMVSVQLGVSIAQAIVRLRAYAFANGRPLTDVASDVVAREIRFESDESTDGSS